MSDPILHARGLVKSYGKGASKINILKGVDIDIYPGDALCILGASGAGKSTLLHLMGGLDQPTAGSVSYLGQDLAAKSDKELAKFRNESMGFVFQFHHLLSEFSALENVELPARLGGLSNAQAKENALELLDVLGLKDRLNHYPSQLSGGEQQRVAIARALVQRPKILLADEPTGNLDRHNGKMIEDLFFALRERYGLTLVVVTHDASFASRFPRRMQINDGHWN